MAVNALGLPLQLQASPLQIQDLLGGLKAGDVLKGRLVELLPEGMAVLNLRGQNLVAQLPAGLTLDKGAVLQLQVTQAQGADSAKAGGVTLRLLPSAAPAEAAGNAPSAPALASQASPSQALPPQAVLDQALLSARLPLTPANQQVVRTLAQAGVPLEPQALQSAVRALEALVANESPAPPAPAPSLPAPVQQALQNALQQVQVAAQLSPPGPAALTLQQAARALTAALQAPPAPLAAPSPNPAQSPVLPAEIPAAPASAPPAPAGNATAPAPPPSGPVFVQSLQSAVTELLAQPNPANAQSLQQLLSHVPAAAPAASAAPAPAAPAPAPASAAAPIPATPAPVPSSVPAQVTTPSAPVLPLAAPAPSPRPPFVGLVQREAIAPLINLSSQASGPLTVETLRQAVAVQLNALQDPSSVPAQRLVQAVQAQYPQAEPAQALQNAQTALQQAQAALAALPDQHAALQPGQLQQTLNNAGIATPRTPLQAFPVETVAEAVAWLQARDLPPQRPLVEAVATFLQQDHSAMPAASRAIEQAQALPQGLLQQRPALSQAVDRAASALQRASLHAEQPGLAQQLQAWASQQGLDLEAGLLSLSKPDAAPRTAAPVSTAAPVADRPALRPALQQLEQQLRHALKDVDPQSPATADRLQSALTEAQNANRALSALPLQAQAAPAFDTVHMPLPVVLGQDLGGRLSVTWRQGRDRTLNDKDPVSVAVALNTGSLGKVKVLLQVWKDAASARVLAEDAATAEFLSDGADELRGGFAERTPFRLQALDFGVDAPNASKASGGPDAPSSGLALSA